MIEKLENMIFLFLFFNGAFSGDVILWSTVAINFVAFVTCMERFREEEENCIVYIITVKQHRTKVFSNFAHELSLKYRRRWLDKHKFI